MTKLDRMDIKCVRDYSPLSNAELMAEIEFYVGVAFDSPLRDPDPEEVLGPARALFDRAEAAQARVVELEAARTVALVRLAEKEQRERAILAASSTGIPWVHDDTFSYIVQELEAARARIAQLEANYVEENRLHAEAAARAANLEAQLAANSTVHYVAPQEAHP